MIHPETLLPLQDELIRLNQLVEDLRILSLAEAGKLTLTKAPTDMVELASQLLYALEPLAEEKNIHLELDKQTNDTILAVDPNRMKQGLLNLLLNALRYTPEHGSIHFRLLKEDNHYLKLMIEDTGIGIETVHLPHLFNRFYRTDTARSRDNGGTGLGLLSPNNMSSPTVEGLTWKVQLMKEPVLLFIYQSMGTVLPLHFEAEEPSPCISRLILISN
jgi:two-component system, OmpR family, sensor histidine kinase BaeS